MLLLTECFMTDTVTLALSADRGRSNTCPSYCPGGTGDLAWAQQVIKTPAAPGQPGAGGEGAVTGEAVLEEARPLRWAKSFPVCHTPTQHAQCCI